MSGACVRPVHLEIVRVTGDGDALVGDGLVFPFAVEVAAIQSMHLKRQRLLHVRIGEVSRRIDDDIQRDILPILRPDALGRDAVNPADIHIDIVAGQRGEIRVGRYDPPAAQLVIGQHVLPQFVVFDVGVQMLLQSFPVVLFHEPTDSRSPGIAAKSDEPEVIENKDQQTDDVSYPRQRAKEALCGTVMPV